MARLRVRIHRHHKIGFLVCAMLSHISPSLSKATGQWLGRRSFLRQDKATFVQLLPGTSRGYASTTALRLNRLLFEPHEVTVEGDSCVAVLPPKDYRAAHVRNILKNDDGDTLRVGVLDAGRNDTAVMEWTQDKSLRIVLGLEAKMLQRVPDSKRPRVDVLLAMQAPLRLERMLPQMVSIGVDRIILCGGNKVAAAYWGSHLLRKPDELRACLVEGLTACGDTAVPRVTAQRRLKLLLRDECPELFPRESTIYAVAHPFRPNPTPEQLMHNYDTRIRDLQPPPACSAGTPARMVLAIGPESGWDEPYELDMFKQYGFQQVSMGNRVLRTETRGAFAFSPGARPPARTRSTATAGPTRPTVTNADDRVRRLRLHQRPTFPVASVEHIAVKPAERVVRYRPDGHR